MSSSSSNTKKILLAAAAATVLGIGAYVLYKKMNDDEEENEEEEEGEEQTQEQTDGKDEKTPASAADEEEALKLKEMGNLAFKQNDIEKAIEYYNKALEFSKKDSHLIYSNRSAAWLKLDANKALDDAKMCVKVAPDWAKGYFRLGKALIALGKKEEAFSQFYLGLKKEPENQELKRILEETRFELAESEPRLKIESHIIRLYFEDISIQLCQTKFASIPVTYQDFVDIVAAAVKENNLDAIKQNPKIQECLKISSGATQRIIVHLLNDVHQLHSDAESFARAAIQEDANDDQALLMLVWAVTRSKGTKNLFEALALIRRAATLNPNDPAIFHVFCSLIQRLHQSIPFNEVVPLLRELQVGLNNPDTVKIMVVDAGLVLWFKFFSDPKMQSILMQEEEDSVRRNLSITEAAIRGLAKGAFSRIVRQPFFVQSLTQILITNFILEKVLCPFRAALMTLQPGDTFDELASFIHALAIQCSLGNYSWAFTTEDEMRSYKNILAQVVDALDKNKSDPAALANDRTFFVRLSQLALYQDLGELEHIHEVVKHMQLEKHGPYFKTLVQHQILSARREEEIRDALQSKNLILAPIQQTSLSRFYNNHPSPTWIPSIIAKAFKKVSVGTELEWTFPNFDSAQFKGKNKVLVAGCGSGSESVQLAITYDNVDVVGVDFSEVQVAYAIRAAEDLNVTNSRFYLGDVTNLQPLVSREGQFDVVVATGILHHVPDPMKAWKELVSVVRKGGIMRIALRPKKFIEMLAQLRTFLASKFEPPIFSERELVPGTNLPKVLRGPTREEARMARALFGELQEQPPLLEEFTQSPQFYTLNEFFDSIFDPCVSGFSFTQISDALKKLDLKLIGYEFPMPPDVNIRYKTDFPDDPDMQNAQHLDEFEERNPGVLKMQIQHISFVCQKL